MRPVRIAVILAVLAGTFPPAGHAAPPGQLLWDLVEQPHPGNFGQPGGAQPVYYTSPVSVTEGKRYVLVIKGQARTTNANSSYSYDGVWQYDYQPSSAQPNPVRCCIDLQIAGHEGRPDRPGDNPKQAVPFAPKTHRYEIEYRPPYSGQLEARDVMRYAQGYTTLTGEIEVELYGPPDPPVAIPTATAFDQPVSGAAPAPGGTAVNQSPPLGDAKKVEVTESGLSVEDVTVLAGLRQACYADFLGNALFGRAVRKLRFDRRGFTYTDVELEQDLGKGLTQLALCLSIVDAIEAAASDRSATSAASGCRSVALNVAIRHRKPSVKRSRQPAANVRCKAAGGTRTITISSAEPLRRLVGPRLEVGVVRSRNSTAGGQLSFRYHRG